jgi:Uncharacterized conserved protein
MTTQSTVQKRHKVKLKKPNKWKVLFHNDDITTMELVISILRAIFGHDHSTSEKITMQIHNEGAGVAGVYNYEIAEQKGIEATNMARTEGSPLRITLEEEK